MKKGYLLNEDLRDWWQDTVNGSVLRKNISIILENSNQFVVRRWDLYGCWPKSWKINSFDGKSNNVVTEEITFVVEEMVIN